MKFKRHNIQFDYDETSKYLAIGKTQKVKRKIVQGVLLIVLSIPVLLIVLSVNFFARKIVLAVLLAPVAVGINEIYKYVKLAKSNKFRKLISSESIKIESATGMLDYPSNTIDHIDIEVKKDANSLEGEASIYFQTKSDEKIHILSLRSKKASDAKLDLEYLKAFLEEFMNLKSS